MIAVIFVSSVLDMGCWTRDRLRPMSSLTRLLAGSGFNSATNGASSVCHPRTLWCRSWHTAAILLSLGAVSTTQGHASTVPLVNAYLGIIKTLYSLSGSTTVQPAHALHNWHYIIHGLDGSPGDGVYWGARLYVIRNPATGAFFYYTYDRDTYTGTWMVVNTDPFWVGDSQGRLSRHTWTCVWPGDPPEYTATMNEIELFSLDVWAASVTTSGLFPPGPPYESYLKSHVGYYLYNCDDTTPYFEDEVRSNRIDLQPFGSQVVTMPITQRVYAFPMLQWVGAWYDH